MNRYATTERFREFARRSRDVVLLAAVTGALTGLGVALFERAVVEGLFDHLVGLSPWLLAFMPLAGLLLAWLFLRFVALGSRHGNDGPDRYRVADLRQRVRARHGLSEHFPPSRGLFADRAGGSTSVPG